MADSSEQAGKPVAEVRLRECVAEKREFLAKRFPGVDIDLELEELVAKYGRESIGSDPWLIVLRWFRKLPLPTDRTSPHPGVVVSLADQVMEANRQAAREFCGVGVEVTDDGAG